MTTREGSLTQLQRNLSTTREIQPVTGVDIDATYNQYNCNASAHRAQALAEPGWREEMRMLDSALSAEAAMGGRASSA